ncbi:hypothetical protein L486_06388 [Kwoniella mangroviensis CBS 10435]|uniref:DAGKc domain-containing protein n=1 Tax=Kwoniella mangroviensis CBS 10435 TaxID=1331196 RepID=A0A1B9IM54_9TREE|nr:hypothetical protein L486_06388 [Kwoniella mangroviensis CBS 10435]
MSITQETLHLIVNPVSGHGKGVEFVSQTIVPILEHLSISHQIYTTTSPGDAGNIGKKILLSSQNEGTVRVGIVGGDGTFHEFMEGECVSDGQVRWEVILFPHGTANALYSSLFPPALTPSPLQSHQALIETLPSPSHSEETLYSLLSLFSYLAKTLPVYLPITQTTLSSPTGAVEQLCSHVVLSTSLHAAILEDSEKLRESHPGTERFKIAAQQNASKLFYASVTLQSQSNLGVEQWDPRKGDWGLPYTIKNTTQPSQREITIEGPFSYFLTTSTVDRLEPQFVISPLTSSNQHEYQGYLYITIIRPLRDRFISQAQPEDRKDKLAKRAFEVVGQAYSNGNHVNLTLSEEDELRSFGLENKGKGEPVVEVFRCDSFEWIPTNDQRKVEGLDSGNERLVCADGALHTIPQGGSAKVKLEDKKNGKNFYVFA